VRTPAGARRVVVIAEAALRRTGTGFGGRGKTGAADEEGGDAMAQPATFARMRGLADSDGDAISA
jgi:hypothetical protein